MFAKFLFYLCFPHVHLLLVVIDMPLYIIREFWEKRVKPESEEQGDCKSDIFDITPHVYLKYCKKVDFRKFLQAHGFIGSIHYALQKKNLPYYYFPSYNLEFPVGEAVILSASTHKHLKNIGLLPNFKYKDDVMLNRLFRMVSW